MATHDDKLRVRTERLPEFLDGQLRPEFRQLKLEAECVAKGVELYHAAERELADLPPGRKLLREIIVPLVKLVEDAKDEAKAARSGGGLGAPIKWHKLILVDDAPAMAAITALAALRSVTQPPTTNDDEADKPNYFTRLVDEVAREIGDWIEQREQARTHGANPDELGHRAAAALENRIAVGTVSEWPPGDRIVLGTKLLELLGQTGHFRFALNEDRGEDYETPRVIEIAPDIAEKLDVLSFRAEAAKPRLLPMLCRPLPWQDEKKKPAECRGGYLTINRPLVRPGLHEHTATLDAPMSAHDRVALTILQNTAWRINKRLLDVLRQTFENWLPPFKTPRSPTPKLPPRLQYEEWNALDDLRRAALNRERAKIHKKRRAKRSAQRRRRAKRDRLLDQIVVADLFRDEAKIYFPWSIDFRGRAYPIPMAGPHPQSDDAGRSLLEFANGEMLGERGWHWLRIHAANCAGKDKLTHEERLNWIEERKREIIAVAAAPLSNTWWAEHDAQGKPKIDKPWGFLAACFELAEAWKLVDPTLYTSHLPIALDGSCNGLQHLAALTRDEEIGRLVNMTATNERQDIYEIVARDVAEIVATDARSNSQPNNIARLWHRAFQSEGVARKVVKQPIMTTPYGSTDRGVRNQILDVIDDGGAVPVDFEGQEWGAANYLQTVICRVRKRRLARPMAFMEWLKNIAGRLANDGLAIAWNTPNHSNRVQRYLKTKSRRYTSKLLGEVSYDERTGEIDARKQRSGVAPNFVHSFDSAHLLAIVLGCYDENERRVGSISCVHDSIAVPAADIDTLARVIRQEFIEIYQYDYYLAEIGNQAPDEPMPKHGNLDISQVADNPFFFN